VDHRQALEACRKGGERLLKALRDKRYNARPEYGETLEYYIDDLPKTAGAGNILLANDQVRILHAMFLAGAAILPEGFASRLKSVIANQFALNAFYEAARDLPVCEVENAARCRLLDVARPSWQPLPRSAGWVPKTALDGARCGIGGTVETVRRSFTGVFGAGLVPRNGTSPSSKVAWTAHAVGNAGRNWPTTEAHWLPLCLVAF
jgi:hypothetical protein